MCGHKLIGCLGIRNAIYTIFLFGEILLKLAAAFFYGSFQIMENGMRKNIKEVFRLLMNNFNPLQNLP